MIGVSMPHGYRGYLQTDDYGGYHTVGAQSGVTHLDGWLPTRP